MRKLPALDEKVVRFIVARSDTRGWLGYPASIATIACLFFISHTLVGESAALFAIIYLLASIAVAVFFGLGPGVMASFLAALSIDYHYIEPIGSVLASQEAWFSYAICLISISLILLVLGCLRILDENFKRTKKSEQNALDAVQAREEILSIVAHDLRQPLSSIVMRAELIERRGDDVTGGSVEKLAMNIRQDVVSLERMINDLLDISKIDSKQLSVRRETVDLVELVTALIDSFRAIYPIRSFVLAAPPTMNVDADSQRCRQVVGNLVSNALKYGYEGTEIQICIQQTGEFAQISVTNHGHGIAQEQISKVFNRYLRTDDAKASRVAGLGLGLFITKSLIEAQGGSVWAESKLDEKTSFHFTLPLAPQGPVHIAEQTSQKSTGLKNWSFRRHVLVVDDSSDSLALLQIFFEKSGAQVTSAQSANEAIVKLATIEPELIISDIEMPDGDGYDLMAHVHQWSARKGRKVPVVALTGHSDVKVLEKIKEAGFHSYISKPVSLSRLTSSVDAVFR